MVTNVYVARLELCGRLAALSHSPLRPELAADHMAAEAVAAAFVAHQDPVGQRLEDWEDWSRGRRWRRPVRHEHGRALRRPGDAGRSSMGHNAFFAPLVARGCRVGLLGRIRGLDHMRSGLGGLDEFLYLFRPGIILGCPLWGILFHRVVGPFPPGDCRSLMRRGRSRARLRRWHRLDSDGEEGPSLAQAVCHGPLRRRAVARICSTTPPRGPKPSWARRDC